LRNASTLARVRFVFASAMPLPEKRFLPRTIVRFARDRNIGALCGKVDEVVRTAVVAREYGLPAVLNLRSATKVFRTGDRVVLDADRGVLSFDDSPA
jgi:phosphoenolpyruvate-protein kinase (PTS system EI component)